MAFIRPQGTVSWEASPSEDVVAYKLYQSVDGSFDYVITPSVNLGLALSAQLPVEGLPPIASGTTVTYAATSVDGAGNESDFIATEAVLIDVEPPLPPASITFVRF
jgi:hypothetical protein